MPTSIIPLKASEWTWEIQFYGPDSGVWPASPPGGSSALAAGHSCFNSFSESGGDQTNDFKCAQDLISLHRVTGKDWSVRGSFNFKHPAAWLSGHATYGPLVQITGTGTNATGATTFVKVWKGLMLQPDLDFLGNPGSVTFEVRSYGLAPSVTGYGT